MSSSVTIAASERTAALIIPSVTADAWASTAPSPRPGNTNMLLPWPVTISRPWNETGGNGDPLAKRHSALVQWIASWAEHSDFEVGFESGKMSGRGHDACSARMIASLNAPDCIESPTSADGLTSRMTVMRSSPSGMSGRAYGTLKSSSDARWVVTRPFESRNQNWRRAASGVSPSSTIRLTMRSATPMPAEPAPRKTQRRSLILMPRTLAATRNPAAMTAPVP
eukprot:Amastigsp_a339857_74.p3 type:complete len:224 gc:universal Amastigsp_a339857_74:258-929(+)